MHYYQHVGFIFAAKGLWLWSVEEPPVSRPPLWLLVTEFLKMSRITCTFRKAKYTSVET